jgi:predicted phosphodiesterase
MSRVLVSGDSHIPYEYPTYLRFLKDLRDKHQCDTFIHIGDVMDIHSISAHEKNPSAAGANDEYEKARKHLAPWVKAFPEAKVCIGNHEARVGRQAASVNIPEVYLRRFPELWDTPGWDWQKQHVVDGVLYIHGTGFGGLHPAFNAMSKLLMSVVMGHIHTAAGISWKANPTRRIFGMSVGTGIDDKEIAFTYAENNPLRSIVSAAVVLDGVPQHIIMPMGPGEKYHRSKARR